MNHNDAFSRCHPLVNFLYFALVLLGAMVLRHPVCQVLSLIGAIACFCCLGGEKPGGFRLWYALALVVLTGLMLLVLPVGFGSGRTAGILQSVVALFAAGICGYLGFLQAHNGKEGVEDELD